MSNPSEHQLLDDDVQATPGPAWETISFLIVTLWAGIFTAARSSVKDTIPSVLGLLVFILVVGIVIARRNNVSDLEVLLRRWVFPFACLLASVVCMLHDSSLTMTLLAWYGACQTITITCTEVQVGHRFSFDDGSASISVLAQPDQHVTPRDDDPGRNSQQTTDGTSPTLTANSGRRFSSTNSRSISPSNNSPQVPHVAPSPPTSHPAPPGSANSVSTIGTSVSQLDKRAAQRGGPAGNPLMVSAGNLFISADSSSEDDMENDPRADSTTGQEPQPAVAVRRSARVPISISHPKCLWGLDSIRAPSSMFTMECERMKSKGDIHHPPRDTLQLLAPKVSENLGAQKSLRMRRNQQRAGSKSSQLGDIGHLTKPRGLGDLSGGWLQLPPLHASVVFAFVMAALNHLVFGFLGPVFQIVTHNHVSGGFDSTTALMSSSKGWLVPFVEAVSQFLLLAAILALLVPPVLQSTEERSVIAGIVQVYAKKTYTQPHKRARVDGAMCHVNILSDMAIAAGQNISVSIIPSLEDGSTPRYVDQERRMAAGAERTQGAGAQVTTCVTPMIYALSEASFMAGAEYAENKVKRGIRDGNAETHETHNPRDKTGGARTGPRKPVRSGNTVVSATSMGSSNRSIPRVQAAWGEANSIRSVHSSTSAFQSGSFRQGRTVAASSTSPGNSRNVTMGSSSDEDDVESLLDLTPLTTLSITGHASD